MVKNLDDIEVIGGHPAVDFVNTVHNWTTDEPGDYLTGYDDFLRWWEISGWDGSTVAAFASRPASEKRAAFDEVRRLREDLYAVLSALTQGKEPPQEALERFNTEYRRAVRWMRFETRGKDIVQAWRFADAPAQAALAPLVWQAGELIRSGPLDRLKRCPADDCGWLFLDLSKNRSRQWCSMSTCGNAAKVRRFRRRKKGE